MKYVFCGFFSLVKCVADYRFDRKENKENYKIDHFICLWEGEDYSLFF